MKLESISATVAAITGQTGLNGATAAYFPPSFEASDPIPVQNRGYWFGGTQYVQLPPAAGTSGAALVLPTTFSFSAWIRPQSPGVIRTVFSKGVGCQHIFTIRLTTLEKVEILGGLRSLTYSNPNILATDVWTYVGITAQFSSVSRTTTISFYFNGTLHASSYTGQFLMMDYFATASQYIGCDALLTNFYHGFIWRITIRNYAYTAYASDIAGPAQPADQSFPLSPAPQLSTSTGLSCGTLCSNGCVRTTDCSFCADPMCDVCGDFTSVSCIACIPNTVLTTKCDCVPGRFFNSATRTCDQCQARCSSCVDSVTCSACVSPYVYSQSDCLCPNGYYPSSTNCLLCDTSCGSCSQPSRCTQCNEHAYLDASGQCHCIDSYYPSPTAGSCAPCDPVCATCENQASQCLSCKANASLSAWKCACNDGFVGSADNCQPCNFGCSQCGQSQCAKCFPGYFLVDSICAVHCNEGFAEDPTHWLCIPLVNPYTNVTAKVSVDKSNSVILNFSQSVSPKLKKDDVAMSLSDMDGIEFAFTSSFAELSENQTFNISINVTVSYLPERNQFSVAFLHPEAFSDGFGNRLITRSISTSLSPVGSPPTTSLSNRTYVPQVSTQVAAVATASTVGGVAAGVLSGSPSSVFSLINNVQLLTYIPLSTLNLPADLKAHLVSINMQAYLKNPFTASVDLSGGIGTMEFASNYGYETSAFLPNAGKIVAIGLVILASWPVVAALAQSSHRSIANYFSKMLEEYRWGTFLRFGIESYLDLSIAALLQLRSLSFDTALASANSVLGMSVSLISLLSPVLLIFLTIRQRAFVQSHNWIPIAHWKCLYEEFRNDKGYLSTCFYSLFLLRRLLFAVTLTCLNAHSVIQALLGALHCLAVSFPIDRGLRGRISPGGFAVRLRHSAALRVRVALRVFPHMSIQS